MDSSLSLHRLVAMQRFAGVIFKDHTHVNVASTRANNTITPMIVTKQVLKQEKFSLSV